MTSAILNSDNRKNQYEKSLKKWLKNSEKKVGTIIIVYFKMEVSDSIIELATSVTNVKAITTTVN